MFNKEKKYTLEEIKVMFENAKKEALEKFDNDVERITKANGIDDPFQKMMMNMQNMMAYAELFKEDTE